jgi:uncharacterized protein
MAAASVNVRIDIMKIAVLSDSHDNIWVLRSALQSIQDADLLICCGDLCSPFVVPIIAENFTKPIHMVYGNNDGDPFRITKNANRFSNVQIDGELFIGEIGGKSFAVNHYDNIGLEIAKSQVHNVVCFGHNHHHQVERFGKTLVINPGAIMGYSPLDQREIAPTFVIYDTDQDLAASYQVLLPDTCRESMSVKVYP